MACCARTRSRRRSSATSAGSTLVPELVASERGIETHHRRLLLDLVVAADDGETRAMRQPAEHLRAASRCDLGAELRVGDRDSRRWRTSGPARRGSPARRRDRGSARLVGAGAGDPQHVHPGVADLLEQRAQPRRGGASEIRSAGVQTAPRTKIGTPLSSSVRPSDGMSAGIAACGSRSGASPRSRRRPQIVSSCSAGSPCVCGHHRAASSIRSSAASRPSSAGCSVRRSSPPTVTVAQARGRRRRR